MNLKHLTDKTLLTDTKLLVNREREFLTKILHHLREIDRRKLYCELGFSSLHAYCVRELGYSEGNAYRRIKACRLLEEIPEIERKIEKGELSLSNIAQASSFFIQKNVKTVDDKKAVLDQLENLTKSEAEKMLFAISGDEEKPRPEIKRRTSMDTTRLSVVFRDETLERCDYLKGMIGKNFSFDQLIEYMVEICIKDIEKRKFKVIVVPTGTPPPVEVKRVII